MVPSPVGGSVTGWGGRVATRNALMTTSRIAATNSRRFMATETQSARRTMAALCVLRVSVAIVVLQPGVRPERRRLVRPLPGELGLGTAEVSECGGLLVYGPAELQ